MSHDVVFVHLLNDLSGSPKVLCAAIDAATARGWRAKLYVGSSGDGFLSRCAVATARYPYRRFRSKLATLAALLFSQLALFAKLLCDRSIERGAVVYVNTLLPFGASLYGMVTRRNVICHLHETALAQPLLIRFLFAIARRAASAIVFVSDAHARVLASSGVHAWRIHNALDEDFRKKAAASTYVPVRGGRFDVLMIAYLRDYKGVPELVDLAASFADDHRIHFELVLNESGQTLERWSAERVLPGNLSVHPGTRDTAQFYGNASVVVNLSRVDLCMETFGMTLLEAMAFGIPVIAPPVGGPADLVRDGVEGFLVDSRDAPALRARVLQLLEDPALCSRMSAAARARSAAFSPGRFAEEIGCLLDRVRTMKRDKRAIP